MAAHTQLALPRAALAAMSNDELAVQLSALQAESDRRNQVMLAVGPSDDPDDGQPKECSWFGCAPACNRIARNSGVISL